MTRLEAIKARVINSANDPSCSEHDDCVEDLAYLLRLVKDQQRVIETAKDHIRTHGHARTHALEDAFTAYEQPPT